MNIEYEVRVLEIDVLNFQKKLEELGAVKKWERLQKRYTYDFTPKRDNSWVRLRTNGEETTITIKTVVDKNDLGGTQEHEVVVSDFEKMNDILEMLGYKHRNYQENKRIRYILDEVEIEIDTWPLIPTYAEIEGKNKEVVIAILKKLDYFGSDKVTTLDVTSIYNDIYNIDVLNIKELYFN